MSQVERFEGRRHALDALGDFSRMSARVLLQSTIVANLKQSHASSDTDYSRGVRDILEKLDELAKA